MAVNVNHHVSGIQKLLKRFDKAKNDLNRATGNDEIQSEADAFVDIDAEITEALSKFWLAYLSDESLSPYTFLDCSEKHEQLTKKQSVTWGDNWINAINRTC